MPAILLVAHYDTTDVPGYLGANNSATGVGAVIAIARALKGDPRAKGRRAVRFLLTDGEEAPSGYETSTPRASGGARPTRPRTRRSCAR